MVCSLVCLFVVLNLFCWLGSAVVSFDCCGCGGCCYIDLAELVIAWVLIYVWFCLFSEFLVLG